MGSIHKKLERVRKPRVHLVYEVETGGAAVKRELPFVVGVLGDFSGNPEQPLKPLRDRKFVQIDRDNFNDVMASISPELNLRVENTLADDGSEMAVSLKFNSIDDFSPAAVANQVPSLKKLIETRNKLGDLIAKADRSADLEGLLEDALQDPDAIGRLSRELGLGAGAEEPPAALPDASPESGDGSPETPDPETPNA
jgi:type VI secretion system protein ImpB